MTSEFIDNENENSIRNPFYSKKLQDTTKKRLKKLQFKLTPHKKQKLEQLEIEYLLFNTSTNAYVIEVTRNFEINEKNKTNR
jgi:hypothetical protein